MFINDNSIHSVQQLIKELKAYFEMQKEYTKLELTEKLTILFSTLIFAIVLILISMVILFFLSASLAHWLAPYVGGLVGSYAIIAATLLLFVILVVLLRQKLIINPIANFVGKLFLNNSKD